MLLTDCLIFKSHIPILGLVLSSPESDQKPNGETRKSYRCECFNGNKKHKGRVEEEEDESHQRLRPSAIHL
jgi:hypothetical protein